MFWTDNGLKKPHELDINDSILGADRSGDVCWRKVINYRATHELTNCCQIISDSTEIHAPHGIVLCTQTADKKLCKIEEVDRQNTLRIISNSSYVWEKWVSKKDKTITADMAFFLGIIYRRVSLNQDKIIIKIPSEKIDIVAPIVEKKIRSQSTSDNIELSIEHGPLWGERKSPWSWLIIKSQQLVNLIKLFLGDVQEAPLAIRTNLELYQSYIEGLIEVLSKKNHEYTIFETFLQEYEARKLLYNIFFLYAVECKTNATPSFSPDKIVLSVKTSELENVSSFIHSAMRGKKSVSRVRWMVKYYGTTYCVQVEGTDWSPIIDLVYIL